MQAGNAERSLVDFAVHVGDNARHRGGRQTKIALRDLSFWYGEKQALKDVTLDIYDREVTALIGPSGCGKSTLLRCLNRTNELILHTRMSGRILIDGADIYAEDLDLPELRRRFGWIAQKPNPFPMSDYRNVAYGPHLHGLVTGRAETDALVQHALELAGLWDEVKDRLDELGTDLSGGQQQRLCLARAIATDPEIILMDEPASALDPPATAHLEDLIDALRQRFCIVIITHNMQQAARVSQRAAYMHLGEMVEVGDTEEIFLRPRTESCRDYITGRMG